MTSGPDADSRLPLQATEQRQMKNNVLKNPEQQQNQQPQLYNVVSKQQSTQATKDSERKPAPSSSVLISKQNPPKIRLHTCSYNNTTVTVPNNTPNFIMIGVQKSGTTALLTYYRNHPQILQTKKGFTRELHFFDSAWNGLMREAKEKHHLKQASQKNCFILEKYMTLFQTEQVLSDSTVERPLYTFEKTPTYVANPEIPKRMKQVIPWTKAILILRNPIDRLYSQYKMTIKDVFDLREYSLEDFIQHELLAMKYQFNMTTAPLLLGENETLEVYGGTIANTVPPHVPPNHNVDPVYWTLKDASLGKRTDHGPLGSHVLVRRGLYSVQLRWWLKHFKLNEDLLVINYADMASNTQEVYERILKFCGIPIPPEVNTTSKVRADTRKHDRPLQNSTRWYFQEFYAPYNAELEGLLGPEWSVDKLGW
jgi:hypothetical protein